MATARTKSGRASGPEGIQVVARAFSILRTIAESKRGMKLGELARRVELPRPTVHRIVQSLQDEGVLFVTLDGRVRIGPELRRLAVTSQGSLVEIADPFMQQLAQEVGETIDLAVLEGDSIRFIAHVMSTQRLLAGAVVGERFPAYCTAPGKVLLAELRPRALRLALPARLTKLTPHTVTSREELLTQLEEVRSTSLAFDHEEYTEGISAVATAVRGPLGVLAALTIAAPAERFRGREVEYAEVLKSAAAELGGALDDYGD